MQPRPRSVIAVALSLSLAAGALAADKPKKPDKSPHYPVPAGLRGFDGTLAGNVVSVQNHMRGFVLKITQIAHSNARSTAPNPNSAVGHEIEISPTVTKDNNGHYTPDQRELNYIKSLQPGQDIQIDVVNTDPTHFRIANLTSTEKHEAQHEKKAEEKKKD